MANYYGSARSNYFRVKDREAFMEDMDKLYGVSISELERDDTGRFVLLGNHDDGGDWCVSEDTDDEDYEDVYLPERVAPHLAEHEVAIFIDAGSEKLCYIHGCAVAINSKGESVRIMLSDIYEQAKQLTEHPENITEATY